jgi:hypothetical protein
MQPGGCIAAHEMMRPLMLMRAGNRSPNFLSANWRFCFRTNAEQHIKRNLVIFVTARLVNPEGQLVNPNEEAGEYEDVIEPPILPEVPFYKK